MYPSLEYRICRRIAYKKGFFEDVAHLLEFTIAPKVRERMEIIADGIIHGLEEQIFLRYVDGRRFTSLAKREVLNAVNGCTEKYRFLLESSVDPGRFRHSYVGDVLNVMGSGPYCEIWDQWWRREGESGSWAGFQKRFTENHLDLKQRLPSGDREGLVFYHADALRQLSHQIFVRFGHLLFLENKGGGIDEGDFIGELMRRHRWCLERLCRCSFMFLNKYKERLSRELETEWEEGDASFVDTISGIVLAKLTDRQQSLFDEGDWDFGEQMRDRFRLCFPSLATVGEIEERIGAMVSDYGPLLNSETAEVIRELLLDEVDRVAFVSADGHFWNREMADNADKEGPETGPVAEAVEILLEIIPAKSSPSGLRAKMRSRWMRGTLRFGLRKFRGYLLSLPVYAPLSMGGPGGEMDGVNLQMLLSAVDLCFMRPNGRPMLPVHRLDVDIIKSNIARINMSFRT